MNAKTYLYILLMCVGTYLSSCNSQQFQPAIASISPIFGPEETLVTIEGEHLGGITEITFSGNPINFNTAYNSDRALLFRIPGTVPLGDHEVIIQTALGPLTTQFRVTYEAPEVFRFFPESAPPGDQVTIYGQNFYEPLEVFFFDSVKAQVLSVTTDSVVVEVPENVEKGFVQVVADGGVAFSPKQFFTTGTILINDFDGNGLRAETNKWIFVGSVNENGSNAVQNQVPEPVDGNFLKISGKDALDIAWIGGAQNHFGFPGDEFETFGIRTSASNTLLELDVNSNGKENTYAILIMLEKDGSINDFAYQFKIDWEGWERVSLPLTRFKDLNGQIVDPTKVRVVKIHLIDQDETGQELEINVDNMVFLELL